MNISQYMKTLPLPGYMVSSRNTCERLIIWYDSLLRHCIKLRVYHIWQKGVYEGWACHFHSSQGRKHHFLFLRIIKTYEDWIHVHYVQANVLKHDNRVCISLFRTHRNNQPDKLTHTPLKGVFVPKNGQTYPLILMINWKQAQYNPTSTKPWRHKVKPRWLCQHVQLRIEVFN